MIRDEPMRYRQAPAIRFVALTDPDAPFIPGGPDVPTELKARSGARIAVFDIGGYNGIKNYIAIPTFEADEDANDCGRSRCASRVVLISLRRFPQMEARTSRRRRHAVTSTTNSETVDPQIA